MIPVIGKPHFGNVTSNVYNGAVTQKTTPWEMYFWIAVLGSALLFTPLGGILLSKLRKYKAAFLQTAKGIEHAAEPGLKMELSDRMSDRTKALVKQLKAKGEI
jgi:hypothetical protein